MDLLGGCAYHPAMGAKILLIEDEAAYRNMLSEALAARGYETIETGTAEEGIHRARREHFDLILTDVKLPGMSGVDAIPAIKEAAPEADIIVMTAFSSRETAVKAVKRGAYDFFSKPFSLGELDIVIRRALERRTLQGEVKSLKQSLASGGPTTRIIGDSAPMRELKATLERIAPLATTVLVTGESGTGKELVSDTIRALSPRASAPFVKVNCAAIPENLFEAELFGHEKGAFTGASTARPGKFEQAHGGTIMLDEIGEMPLSVQPKLLRAVEQKQIERLGGSRPFDVDVRIIAATNRNLEQRVREKAFREDLFYRLNVASVEIPALRERKEDIPLLTEHFMHKIHDTLGVPAAKASPDALLLLAEHDWPGNVRQLANILERAAIQSTTESITSADLSKALGSNSPGITCALNTNGVIDLRKTLMEMERSLLINALEKTQGNQKQAAELLTLTPKNLWAKLKKHGIDPKSLA